MDDYLQKIKALEEKLKKFKVALETANQEIDHLFQDHKLNKEQIRIKEKELENWRKNFEECQREKNHLKQILKEKINQSQDFNQTKELLNGQTEAIDNLEKELDAERTYYRQIRDKLINRLLEPCQICEAKEQLIIVLNDRINKISIWTFLIFLSSIFHFFMFLYMVFKWIKEKKQKSHYETLKEALNKRRKKIEEKD